MPKKCIEYDLSKVRRITCYPLGEMVTKEKHTPLSTVYPIYAPILFIKSELTAPERPPINFLRGSLNISDKINESVAGYTHRISVSWDFNCITEADYTSLLELQRRPHEVLIDYFGGTRKLVRTDETAYDFTFQDEEGKMKCSMTLNNGQGLTGLSSFSFDKT